MKNLFLKGSQEISWFFPPPMFAVNRVSAMNKKNVKTQDIILQFISKHKNTRNWFTTYMKKTGDAGDNVTANFLCFPPNFRLRTRF